MGENTTGEGAPKPERKAERVLKPSRKKDGIPSWDVGRGQDGDRLGRNTDPATVSEFSEQLARDAAKANAVRQQAKNRFGIGSPGGSIKRGPVRELDERH